MPFDGNPTDYATKPKADTINAAPRPMTEEAFRAWLEAMSPEAVVYYWESGAQSQVCPIARYLGSNNDGGVVTTKGFYRVRGDRHSMPDWGADFITRFDVNGFGTATAADCLAILRASGG